MCSFLGFLGLMDSQAFRLKGMGITGRNITANRTGQIHESCGHICSVSQLHY